VRILLSGGLDSRLLLAELRRQGAEVTALTFGEEDCPDIRIARECARIAGVPHLVRHITGENWWEGREDAVWQTDGLMNAVHFHEAIIRNDLHAGNWITQKSNVADAILHGKHIDEKPADDWAARPEKVLRRRMLKSPFFNADEVLACSAEDARRYLGGPTVEGFYFLQNTRRLNLGGNLLLAPYCEVLLPRASYPLLRLVLSALPPSERAGGKFYLRFLIENYPEYFGNTPWQSSGRGIHESDPVRWARDLRDGGKRYLFNLAPRVPGVWRVASRLRPHYQYFADYPELIRHSGVREKLLSQELLCDEFLDGRSRRVLADPPERAEERAQTILAILSFETYLRQVQGLPGVRGAQSA
jgi:asparagine synthase (glutamine-hydrolysing)